MKRKLLTVIVICMTVLSLMLTACGGLPSASPQKLTAPTVTLSANVASWQADSNADRFEISIDGSLSFVENTVTSKALTDGQTLKVRAIGDGINYTTSDWSNSVTYTQGGVIPQPTKLATPTVTVSQEGLASWNFIANASGYKYKINGGAETVINALSLQLTNGQSITVKAVGDGINYTDSDYSAPVTYTAQVNPDPGTNPDPQPTTAPTYLGIAVSDFEPTQNDVPSGLSAVSYAVKSVSIEDALKAYLQNGDNALGESAPTASNYELYSSIGETVYVQIWLNNPDQNTILSLKLNNVKYQTAEILNRSSFIAEARTLTACTWR